MYATYTDYTTYLGGRTAKITSGEWSYYATKATVYMDNLSSLVNATVITDEIKYCCCEVAELLKADEGADHSITSESNDGYSVSYNTERNFNDKVFDIMKFYLSRTGWLYRGVIVC